MTVLSEVSDVSYATNGLTSTFSVPFTFADNVDVKLSLTDSFGTITFPTNYTLTGAGSATGGSCTFSSPPAAGLVLYIFRDPDMIQDASYIEHARFPAASHEAALDKGTQIDQRLAKRIDGTIRSPYGEPVVDLSLPSAQQRAGKLLGFGPSGQARAINYPPITPLPPGNAEDFAFSVPNAAGLPAYADPHTTIFMRGYETPGDGGGGYVNADPASLRTVNGGTVFPAYIGKYIRPVDGIIHSKWFGIKDHATLDQSQKLQTFLYELGAPGAYRGMLDPGVVNCGGATMYLKRNIALGTHQATTHLEGSLRRSSIIRNCTLAVGTPPWLSLTASVTNLYNFRVEGRVNVWNCEGNSILHGMQIGRAPTGQDESIVSDYPDPYKTDYADWMLTLLSCNHPIIINISIDGKGSFTPVNYKKGVLVNSTANARFLQGTIFGSNPGLQIDGGGSLRTFTDGLKFEQCEGVNIWARGGEDTIIKSWFRMGTSFDTTKSLIRIGEQGVSTAKNTKIEDCYTICDQTGMGTGIYVEQADQVAIDNNHLAAFATGISIRDPGSGSDGSLQVRGVVIGDRNIFDGTVTPISRGNRTKRLSTGDRLTPWPIVPSGANYSINGLSGEVQSMQVDLANRVVQGPTNLVMGATYRVSVKTSATGSLVWTSASDALLWQNGQSAPSLATMTATQVALFTFQLLPDGKIAASYTIYGT